MDNIELILTDLSEEATKRLVIKQKPIGLKENIRVDKVGENVAKVAKENLKEQIVARNNKIGIIFIEEK